jgi:hypothetical protein
MLMKRSPNFGGRWSAIVGFRLLDPRQLTTLGAGRQDRS